MEQYRFFFTCVAHLNNNILIGIWYVINHNFEINYSLPNYYTEFISSTIIKIKNDQEN